MPIRLHRCSKTWLHLGFEPCWKVQRELDRRGIAYELVIGPQLRGKRDDLEKLSGQRLYPVIEFADGTVYRSDSADMAARIAAGALGETASRISPAA
jgi:glutathione S-transferase